MERKEERPAFAPDEKTRAEVKKLVGLGAPLDYIAHEMRCTERELRRHFKTELKFGAAAMNTQ